MTTLMIVATLLSVQPTTIELDTPLFDLQSMREHARNYLIEDVANMNHVIYSALKEGISAGSKFIDQDSGTATLVAQKKDAADTTKQPQSQVN